MNTGLSRGEIAYLLSLSAEDRLAYLRQRAELDVAHADMVAEVQREQARKMAEVPDKARVASLGSEHRVPTHYDPAQADLFLEPDYS